MNFSRLNAFFNWSTPVGSLFGVPIRLHISLTFFLWAALARNGLGFWHGVEYGVLIVISVLLHELGHALSAKKYGLTGLSIMLHGFGGFAVSRGYRTPKQALVISLAGPAVTFVIAAVALAIGTVGRNASTIGTEAYIQFHIIHFIGSLSLLLGVLNLLPMLPFDGGRALAAWLSRTRPEHKADRAVGHLGLILGPILVVYGLATEHDMVAMFGFIGGLSSAMSLMNSGGIKFGEGARDRRARKEDEAFKKRQKAKTEEYLGDVAARAREREEQERLRKLLE